MILDSTMALEFSCDAGTDVEFHASARNVQGSSAYLLASAGVSASTAAVPIIAAPPAGETREVLSVQLRNSGASTRTVTVRVDVSGTDREVRVVSLLTHESLDYSSATGWTHYGADGDAHVSGVALSDTLSGTLDVTGAVTFDDALSVGGTIAGAGAITAVTSVTAADLIATDDCLVGDDLAVTGLATIGETLTVTGDVSAAGGFRRDLAFAAPGAAGVVAAAQTNLDMRHVHPISAVASGYVAKRAGSIVGLGAQLSAAVEGASGSVVAKATVNGTEVGAALDLTFTTVNGLTKAYAVAAKDSIAFAAGDVLGMSYTSHAGVSNTPALWGDLEIEA